MYYKKFNTACLLLCLLATNEKCIFASEEFMRYGYPHASGLLRSATTTREDVCIPDCKDGAMIRDKTFKIAIIGGGGAGTIIASLLSNISIESEYTEFKITLFERNPNIINGSTSEVAAVLHAGGYEYYEDEKTAAECRLAGQLFNCMFPSLYSEQQEPIIFAVSSGSDFTVEQQLKTRERALSINLSKINPLTTDKDSPREITPQKAKSLHGANLAGGIESIKDRHMRVFEKSALIKKHLKEGDVALKNSVTVLSISKDENGQYSILSKAKSGKEKIIDKFDHVILTAWDQTYTILEASKNLEFTSDSMSTSVDSGSDLDRDAGATEKAASSSQFSSAHRVVAICDIRSIAGEIKSIFVIPNGAMFMPLNDQVAIMYRCANGASYPKTDSRIIPDEDVLSHGEEIMEGVKDCFGRTDAGEDTLAGVVLLGARKQSIVTQSGVQLSTRRYKPPFLTNNGVIVAIPLKETFIASLALQTIEQLLKKLPESNLTFKSRWINEIKKIVPSDDLLYTGDVLPDAFTIKNTELTAEEIDKELFLFIDNCTLNDTGKAFKRILLARNSIKSLRGGSASEDERAIKKHRQSTFIETGV